MGYHAHGLIHMAPELNAITLIESNWTSFFAVLNKKHEHVVTEYCALKKKNQLQTLSNKNKIFILIVACIVRYNDIFNIYWLNRML